MRRLLIGAMLALLPVAAAAQQPAAPQPAAAEHETPAVAGPQDPASPSDTAAATDAAAPADTAAPTNAATSTDAAAPDGDQTEIKETGPTAEGGPLYDAKEVFVAKCSSCHSVGKGDRVGPDLKGVTTRRKPDWVQRMIKAPSKMLDTDADARELLTKFKNIRMPDLGLADDQVSSVIELITYCSDNACQLAAKFVAVTNATDKDVARGVALFTGTEALKEGGPACISCHTVRGTAAIIAGGTLAKEITHAFARLGDQGIDAALRNPAFAVMNKVFADHPLAKDEAFALRAFLNDANRDALAGSPSLQHPLSVPLASILGTLLALILMNAAWSRRLRGIRKPLVRNREHRQENRS